jgi:hypothetical protein
MDRRQHARRLEGRLPADEELKGTMKAYVAITGILFGLLTVIHLWRMIEEPHLARQPFFLAVTALSAVLSLWSWRAARASGR